MNIKVKNAIWKVKLVDQINDDDDLGLTKLNEKLILVKRDQTKVELADTIAHELTHAYIYECAHYLSRVESEQLATFVGRNFVEMVENFKKIKEQI